MKPNSRQNSAAGVQELLARAVTHHQNGQLAEARPLYEQVLRRLPQQTDALHLLGLLKGQTGDIPAGIELIRRAVRNDGRQPAFRLNLGRLLEATGQWAEAADSYGHAARLAPLEAEHHRLEANARTRAGQTEGAAKALTRILLLVPDQGEIASVLGDALYDLGRLLPAAAWYGRAVTLRPDLSVAAFNRGAALRDAGRPVEALAAFRAAAQADPLLVQAHGEAVGLCHALGDAEGAAKAGRALLALAPDHAEAIKIVGSALARAAGWRDGARWLARAVALVPEAGDALLVLGTLHQTNGRSAEAARWFRRALAVKPDAAVALSGLGLALGNGPRGDEAVRLAVRAARVAPDDADMAANAGSVLHGLKRMAEALDWHRRAVVLRPDGAQGWTNIGTALLDGSAFEEAIAVLSRALALGAAEHEALARSNLGVALMSVGRHAEAVAAFRAALERAPGNAEVRSNLLFCLCFTEDADLDAVFGEHRRFEQFALPRPAAEARFDGVSRDPERRLRVGYVSPDFQRYPGPGSHFLLPLLSHHDRGRVEVVCYYNDRRRDAATERFMALADGWRDCAGLHDDELERVIRADGIDILVDCDGHMSRNRMPLFARRVAPVQVSIPLYPNTTGLSAMDYQFADPRFAPPSADTRHTEKLIRLPGSVLCYRPADSAVVPPARPPVETEGVFTFGSFNNITKLNASTFALWSRVLAAVPDARLMLKWRGLTGGGVGRRMLEAFARHGIGEERLVLRGPTPDPYEDYVRIDCALDPAFANGGTTMCDALWMGVPVLNLPGEAMISRWGASLIGAVGLTEMIADDEDEYVALAVRLATDPAFLARQREGLRERMARSPLMDEAGYAAAVEAGYRAAWRRWCAGLPPAAIDVGDPA